MIFFFQILEQALDLFHGKICRVLIDKHNCQTFLGPPVSDMNMLEIFDKFAILKVITGSKFICYNKNYINVLRSQ